MENFQKYFLLVLLLAFTPFSNYAQSAGDYENATKVTKGISEALKGMSEISTAEKFASTMSKFSKASKAFSGLAVGLDIGLALFGPEDEKTMLLKEIKNMLSEVQNELGNIRTDISEGFNEIKRQNEFTASKTQIFQSLSNIEDALGKINDLLECGHADKICQQTAMERITDAKSLMVGLSTDLINIRRSCLGTMGDLSSNVLQSTIAFTSADIPTLNAISRRLLGAAQATAYCESMYYAIVHQDNQAIANQHRKDIFRKSEKDIDVIQKSIGQAMEKALQFSTLKTYAGSAVNQIAAKHKTSRDRDMLSEALYKDLSRKWPHMVVTAVAYGKGNIQKYNHYWNNFTELGIPTLELSFDTDHMKGVVWVTDRPGLVNASTKYSNYIAEGHSMEAAVKVYWDYWQDKNLHRYKSDGGANKPFVNMPFYFYADKVSINQVATKAGVISYDKSHLIYSMQSMSIMGVDFKTQMCYPNPETLHEFGIFKN